MSPDREMLIRAWQDPAVRATLSSEDLSQLYAMTNALVELSNVGSTAGVPPQPL